MYPHVNTIKLTCQFFSVVLLPVTINFRLYWNARLEYNNNSPVWTQRNKGPIEKQFSCMHHVQLPRRLLDDVYEVQANSNKTKQLERNKRRSDKFEAIHKQIRSAKKQI